MMTMLQLFIAPLVAAALTLWAAWLVRVADQCCLRLTVRPPTLGTSPTT